MKIKNKMIKYLIIILGLVGGVLIASSIILFAFELDSLFGLFKLGLQQTYIIKYRYFQNYTIYFTKK